MSFLYECCWLSLVWLTVCCCCSGAALLMTKIFSLSELNFFLDVKIVCVLKSVCCCNYQRFTLVVACFVISKFVVTNETVL